MTRHGDSTMIGASRIAGGAAIAAALLLVGCEGSDTGDAVEDAGEQVDETLEEAGDEVQDATEEVGDEVRDAAEEIGDGGG